LCVNKRELLPSVADKRIRSERVSSKMQLRLIAASDMVPFVDSLIAAQRIAGPQKRAGAVAFDDL